MTLAKRRAEALVEALSRERTKIVIPTPALSELLTVIGPDAQQYLEIVARSRLFEVASFDQRAAVELALLNRDVFATADRRTRAEPYQKVKFDRQILAVLRVAGVDKVYTDDASLAARARMCGLTPIATYQIPIPEADRQIRMQFEPHPDIPEPPDITE